MKLMLTCLLLTAASVSTIALAETPQQILQTQASEAARQTPGFASSAQRGNTLFAHKFNVSAKMPSCSTCHTDNPAQPGRHAITGKSIKPLAPAANSERFTDIAKVEKWFRRNCTEVVGRECNAAEKADFIQFLTEVR
jgi:mono/diheme cytochrome c family protein